MICVSYTRSLPNVSSMKVSRNTIGDQNEIISQYLKKKKWKLTGKYSDRKQDRNDETAFLEMKKDGMDRKYECIVVASIFFCGKKYISATDLLRRVFYPAGIHFAVAEDDFCSAEVTPAEVEAYLQKKLSEFRGKHAINMNEEFFESTAYMRYGYIRTAKDQLAVDPKPAEVIREIFRLFCEGKREKEIASILDERGIENSSVYRWKQSGGRYKFEHEGWNDRMITTILKNRLYLGEWYHNIGNERLLIGCPAIISQDEFELAQDMFKQRSTCNRKKKMAKRYKVFRNRVYDKETNWPLSVHVNKKDGSRLFRFKYPAPASHMYNKLHLPCAEVEAAVKDQLSLQRERAKKALSMIDTPDAAKRKEDMLVPLRIEAKAVFKQMTELENCLLSESTLGTDNADCKMKEQKEIQSSLDAELQSWFEKMEQVNQLFSKKNPWIKLYSSIEVADELTEAKVKKYVEKVLSYRFEKVEMIPCFQEWYERLPKEWFADLEGK